MATNCGQIFAMRSSPTDPAAFRRACSRFATGVTICTVIDSDGKPQGLTANSFTSVSLEPPMVLICLDHGTNLIEAFRAAGRFAVNVLGREQTEHSIRFAARGHDRFESVPWRAGANGAPLIDGALAQFECAVREVVRAGDHDVFLAEVTRCESREGDPLVYFSSAYFDLRNKGN
jgi:flavin reductase (DIM6/NTAB) family NADH-FMN oxidoreductase RutF